MLLQLVVLVVEEEVVVSHTYAPVETPSLHGPSPMQPDNQPASVTGYQSPSVTAAAASSCPRIASVPHGAAVFAYSPPQ
jgi:hypothetical protein